MIQIKITVEGQTEERFVKWLLAPYLKARGLNMQPVLMLNSLVRRSRGGWGNGNYQVFKAGIMPLLKAYPLHFHTTLVDYYGLAQDWPRYAQALALPTVYERVHALEAAFAADVNHPNLIPYIQVHEFEALLFSRADLMDDYLETEGAFTQMRAEFSQNPEFINNSRATAPSKRILSLRPSYKKTVDGLLLAQSMGIEAMRQACPHFNDWLTRLEGLVVGE